MSAAPERRTVIVAAIDGAPGCRDVVRAAIGAARGFPIGEIHYVHVVEPPIASTEQPSPTFRTDELLGSGRRLLEDVIHETAERFVGRVESHVVLGFAARGILQVAADLEADLIVVGSNGRGWVGRLVCGSVARTILNHAPCAVLVARPPQAWSGDDTLIEAPCESCHALQRATRGAQLWCESHRMRRVGPHLHVHAEASAPKAYRSG